MSAQNSSGIQTLLEAEKEASKIVQKARAFRVQRLKDARSEAQKEIEEYKKEKELELEAYLKEHEGNKDQIEAEMEKETKKQLTSIQEAFEKNKDSVSEKLIDILLDVNPHIHRNYIYNKKAKQATLELELM